MTEPVTLTVNGQIHRGWKDIQIERSIERLCGRYDISLTDTWTENGAPRRRSIARGMRAELAIGGAAVIAVIAGFVDDTNPSYDAQSYTVQVIGRDSTADLVDCAAIVDGGAWDQARLDRIVSDICRPFGIAVQLAAEPGEIFERFALEPGETAYAAIERACRLRGLLPVADGRGGLVVTRPSGAPLRPGTLKRGPGGAILRAQGAFSNANRYSQVMVRGAQLGFDGADPAELAEMQGIAADKAIGRYRPTIVHAESAGGRVSYADRAAWEVRVRAGRGQVVTATVVGWRDLGGEIWRPGVRQRISDDWLVVDAELLVVGVTYLQEAEQQVARLKLMPPYAFDMLTPKPDEDGLGWGSEKVERGLGDAIRRASGSLGGQR